MPKREGRLFTWSVTRNSSRTRPECEGDPEWRVTRREGNGKVRVDGFLSGVAPCTLTRESDLPKRGTAGAPG